MSRKIFRATALQRYQDNTDKLVLPRYATPPWPALMWTLGGLLLALAALLWSARTPLYVTGPGVIVRSPGEGQVALAIFLPPEVSSQVKVGQTARLSLAESPVEGPVVVIEPAAAPAVIRARYHLDSSAGLLVEGPAAVALVRLELSPELMLGSIGEARIEVGAQRGLALLPGLGRFFGPDNLVR